MDTAPELQIGKDAPPVVSRKRDQDDTVPPISSGAGFLLNAAAERNSVRFYKPELDVLRFIAFLSVFLYHASLFAPRITPQEEMLAYSGAFGMCLFFVLSAFLITELLLREKLQTGTIHIRSFYVRRILRIWPLYFAFIAFCVLLGEIHRKWHLSAGLVLSFAGLVGNWYLIHAVISGPVMPLWSISLEEQFYLIWPRAAKYGTRALFWFSIAVMAASCAVVFALSRNGWGCYQIWWNSFAQFQFFGLGALFAMLCQGRTPKWAFAQRLGFFVLGVLCWFTGSFFTKLNLTGVRPASSLLYSYLLAGAGCICLFLGLLGSPEKWWPKNLLYLGKISYGLYVFHFLSLHIVQHLFGAPDSPFLMGNGQFATGIRTVIAFALTLGPAALSYRFLEKPFLSMKERFAFVKSRQP